MAENPAYFDDTNTTDQIPSGKIFRISYDAVVKEMKIIAKQWTVFDELREAFSAQNSAAFFVSRYGYKAEEKLYAINKFGYFLPGLIFEILKWIKTNFGDLSCVALSDVCKRYILEQLTPLKQPLAKLGPITVSNLSDDLGRNNERIRQGLEPFNYRDYQKESLEYLLNKGYGRGLIEVPTSGGKSLILANFIWNIHKNIDAHYKYFILVPNKQLVTQFYGDLIDYGLNPKLLTKFTRGEKFDKDAMVIIGNRQYLFNNASKLPKIDVLICDEAHTCTAEASKEFIMGFDAKIKIGCSGTLPRDNYQKWMLIGMFSSIVYEKDIKTLQDAGFISKLKITLLKITDKDVENNTKLLFHTKSEVKYKVDEFGHSDIEFNDAYNAEHEYFEKNYKDLYKPVFDYLYNLNSNTLILFDRINIGKNLFEYAKEIYKDKNVFYIDGSIDVKDREETRAKFEQCDGNLLIAQTAVFSTGINIKRLQNLVFLTSSKSFSRVIQSIGRILRLHESKDMAHLIDVSWNFKYSQKHLHDRLKIYKTMYGKRPDETLKIDI